MEEPFLTDTGASCPRTFESLPTQPRLGFLVSPGADPAKKKKNNPLEFCSQERKPRQAEDLKGIKVKFLEEAANYPGPRGCAGSGGIGVGESGWDQGLWERGSRGEGIALGFLSVIPGFHCQASPGASRKAPRVGGGEEEVEGEIFVE